MSWITTPPLDRLAVRTVGDLAALPLEALRHAVGDAAGTQLHHLAHGRDDRPLVQLEDHRCDRQGALPKRPFDRHRPCLVRLLPAPNPSFRLTMIPWPIQPSLRLFQ